MSLGQNIRYLRTQKGYSQDYLAEKLGYKSFTTIQKWESGISEPPVKKLKELSVLFGVDMDDLNNEDLSEKISMEKKIAPLPNILQLYNQLNDTGKKEAEKRVEELTHLPKYTSGQILMAAHERTDIDVTDEMKKHDEDIMNDENF